MRSANAPAIRAGVMIANVIWKNMKIDSGMRAGQRIDRLQCHRAQHELVEAADERLSARSDCS